MSFTDLERRDFLALTAAGALSMIAGVDALAANPAELSIIDTHQHLWDLSRFKLAWLAPGSPLDRSFMPDDYREATAGLNVVKSIYMEVDVVPDQHVAEARAILELIRSRKSPMVAAVISGRPASDDFGAYLARFKDDPEIKGVRQVLHGESDPPGYCLDPKFVRGIRLLGEAGLMFDICIRSAELTDAAKLIDACPGTRFILDHCGNADVRSKDLSEWKADIEKVARRDRVVCKVSGIVASTKGEPWSEKDLAPIIHHVLDVFGPDRVMFGGDWPVCTLGASYRRWVEALKAIVRDRPEADQKKLFHGNASRVYRLDAK